MEKINFSQQKANADKSPEEILGMLGTADAGAEAKLAEINRKRATDLESMRNFVGKLRDTARGGLKSEIVAPVSSFAERLEVELRAAGHTPEVFANFFAEAKRVESLH